MAHQHIKGHPMPSKCNVLLCSVKNRPRMNKRPFYGPLFEDNPGAGYPAALPIVSKHYRKKTSGLVVFCFTDIILHPMSDEK